MIVHVVTRKGMGYPPAEADEAELMHSCGVIDPATGVATKVAGRAGPRRSPRRWSPTALSAATSSRSLRPCRPTGLTAFGKRFPDRLFDVGIAEQHALTSAAGLAMGGLHPVVAIYSTFLNRAFDQIMMDVALHKLPVTLVLDRAGITGPTAPATTACGTCRCWALCPACGWPRPATPLVCVRSSARHST
ncbi:transketolase, pyrimidine binding domain protein [Mycobacterium xenopi 4042]|uniref:Transketolase, pyrimidine binding domain protein n=1 Tax=Mycobacterium xenopi 4042 TaxID=1299334 RepID=X8CEG6_MYCXE|nr:transketolase, pyrimidine binding domain protein [Mycobacterium xenopi 4042]